MQYKINNVEGPKYWSGEHGSFADWRLVLTDANGQQLAAIRTTKVQPDGSTHTPMAGEVIDGELDFSRQAQNGGLPKIKPVRQQQGGGGGGARGGGGMSPERQAAITRQHSQEMAIRAMAAAGQLQGANNEAIANGLKSWADWFDADVKRAAGAAASSGGGQQAQQPAQQQGGWGQQQQMPGAGNDSDIPFAFPVDDPLRETRHNPFDPFDPFSVHPS